MPRSFAIVVAADLANGIGLRGGLPWRLRKDMAFFAKLTSKVVLEQGQEQHQDHAAITRVNACIMGRRTWESIPIKFRPLISRLNIIVSRNPHYLDDKPEKNHPLVALVPSLEAALELVESYQKPATATTRISMAPRETPLEAAAMAVASILPSPVSLVPDAPLTLATPDNSDSSIHVERVFLIGGAQLYNEGVQSKDCTHIFMTRVQSTVECDTFFPEIRSSEYQPLSSPEFQTFLEKYLQEPVEGGMIEEGAIKYEYTVYNRL
ncbi:hypothetical protein EDD11_000979 [Mortierella claussenii]|nr:hypothetical protein EDD11_000979 [Mortierella claussenii]